MAFPDREAQRMPGAMGTGAAVSCVGDLGGKSTNIRARNSRGKWLAFVPRSLNSTSSAWYMGIGVEALPSLW